MRLASEKFKCHSNEHTAEFAYDNDIFYCILKIRDMNFLNRIIFAIKYIFGYKCRLGERDIIYFTDNEVMKLIPLIHDYSYNKKHFMEGEKTRVIPETPEIDMV